MTITSFQKTEKTASGNYAYIARERGKHDLRDHWTVAYSYDGIMFQGEKTYWSYSGAYKAFRQLVDTF